MSPGFKQVVLLTGQLGFRRDNFCFRIQQFNGNLYKMDVSVKRISRAGPCLSLFPLFHDHYL